MIPLKDKLTEVDKLGGEWFEFSIGDPAWVMDSLSGLYSDKEMAVIREYSTNAYDAHVEAGNKNPIQITLPTVMNPYFVVEDFGTGMSPETLKTTYTSFGTSTKRTSNKYNGVYGFGSKAAIAYANQFTIQSNCDGFTTYAIISRKTDRSIGLQILSTEFTDEPNGTRIEIPVQNITSFSHKAMDFYRFWLPGMVLVDGKEPEHSVGAKIHNNLYYSHAAGTSHVVMGNVPYRINNPRALFKSARMSQFSFVAYVPLGSVEHPPSREDLMYTDHTKNTLQRVVDDFEGTLIKQGEKEILTCKTYTEAWDKWHEWRRKLDAFHNLEYKGHKFVTTVPLTTTPASKIYYPGKSRYSTDITYEISLSDRDKTLIVHNFDSVKELGGHHKAVARRYLDYLWTDSFFYGKANINRVIFTPETVDSVWLNDRFIVTYDQMKTAIPRKPNQKRGEKTEFGRISGSWDYITKDGKEYEKMIPTGRKIYYISTNKKDLDIRGALTLLNEDAIVIVMPQNRLAKFQREHPEANEFLSYVQTKINFDGPSLVSDQAKTIMAMNYEDGQWLDKLPLDELRDPAFKELRELRDKKDELLSEYEKNFGLAVAIGKRYSFKTCDIQRSRSVIFWHYPLMKGQSTYSADIKHVVIYLNAAYAAMKGKK